MDSKEQARIIEGLKAKLTALMAKYEPRIKDSDGRLRRSGGSIPIRRRTF
jgi:hypothetical protein